MKWLLLLIPMVCMAGGSSDTTVIVNLTDAQAKDASGVALSIATSQHQFDFGTYSLQGSVAVGGYGDSNAFSFGVGQRMCKGCMMINGSVGIEQGELGYGVGANWRFK